MVSVKLKRLSTAAQLLCSNILTEDICRLPDIKTTRQVVASARESLLRPHLFCFRQEVNEDFLEHMLIASLLCSFLVHLAVVRIDV